MYHLTECNLCKGKSFFILYSQSIGYNKPWSVFLEKSFFPLTIRGKLCLSCGWIFKELAYDSEELASLYNMRADSLSVEAEMLADINARYRGQRIFQTVEPWLLSVGHVLDVGGRNGELMQDFIEKGFKVSVLDMDAGNPISRQMIKIRSSFLAWNENTYDLITMSHVLEHTASPGEFLLHARKLLKEDGILFIEVPSELCTCLIKRHVGDHRHLCYFTRETLRGYLDSSGFECVSCKLLVDLVGSKIPLIRAVAKKAVNNDTLGLLHPSRSAVFRSLEDVLHPITWFSRIFRGFHFGR